ncbi:MAG: phosphoglucomutase/phosphomannomutase family protein [Anaerolineales bacterium]
MAQPPIHFGTDGWRGKIAEDYTFDSVRRCAHGFAQYLQQVEGDSKPVIIGFDRRFDSDEFAEAAAEVMAANGFSVLLTDRPTPTPAISYSVVAHQAVGAINITASHNPPEDNGFKVRDRHGGAVAPDGLKQIEAAIPESADDVPNLRMSEALDQGLVHRFDAAGAYDEQIARLVDLAPLRAAGLRVLYDPMWGNGSGWFERLLGGGSTEIITIHKEHNPLFPEMARPEPIPPNIDAGLRATVKQAADVLIINDGDADRVGFGDEHGQFIDQLRAYGLLAYYLLEVRGERGPIVKTLSTTSMLEVLGKKYDVPVFQTGVGFKYVAPKMLETDAMIGGEESGGYAFHGHVPERDGLLAALYFIDMMVRTEQTPSELVETLFSVVGPHYYDRIDTPLPPGERSIFRKNIESADPKFIGGLKVEGLVTLDGYKYNLEDGGWLLIRFSGTEPIVRVYCETTEADRVQPILQDGLKIVGIEEG